jgi:thymidylate synthase
LEIINKRENIEDYCEEDFIIHNYKHHEPLKYIMVR